MTESSNIDLKIRHNAGFFSCCSIRLYEIITYFNISKKLPNSVDSSEQFEWYKPTEFKNKDITYHYFKEKIECPIEFIKPVKYHWDDQYENYKLLNYDALSPFIKNYFSPTDELLNIMNKMEKKYNIENYDNLCVLFYRGNDKVKETQLCGYEEIIEKAKQIQVKNPDIKFLIQSDETEFIEKMKEEFPNSFYFKDEARHMKKQKSTVDIVFKNFNYRYSKFYLAITIIMSKCKYIICGSSGNCSIWIMFYRNNADNVFQYLNGMWL